MFGTIIAALAKEHLYANLSCNCSDELKIKKANSKAAYNKCHLKFNMNYVN